MRPRRPPREAWSEPASPDDPPPAEPVDLPPPDLADFGDELRPAASPPPRARREPEALEVCLRCGESPEAEGECEHREVARVASPDPALAKVVDELRRLSAQRRSQERALQRLLAAAVSEGAAAVETRPPRRPPEPVVTVCPKCVEAAARAAKGERRKASAEAQTVLPFARRGAG